MNEVLSIGPRSGRTKIAQRFIAGMSSSLIIAARAAGDRVSDNRMSGVGDFLSPVSRARRCFLPMIPALEVLGYYRSSAPRTQLRLLS